MRKYSLLLALIVLLAACRHYSTYQDRDKWMLTYRMTRMTLRNRPREVTEYIYAASDTTTPGKRNVYYSRYRFDSEGNMISRNIYMNDTLWLKFEQWEDQNGVQQRTTTDGKVVTTISQRLSDGRYMIVGPYPGYMRFAKIISFLSGGDEKVREDYFDSTAKGKPLKITHFFYKGDRLIRSTEQTAAGAKDFRYFYSVSDAPDSLLTYQGSATEVKLLERQLFFQNDHGDVLREIVIKGRDTTRLEDNTYTYDAKGNWVRRVQIPRKFDPTNDMGKRVGVIDREIVY
jgi:hypothetical protein